MGGEGAPGPIYMLLSIKKIRVRAANGRVARPKHKNLKGFAVKNKLSFLFCSTPPPNTETTKISLKTFQFPEGISK
jgi:hypothetical protein